MIAIKSIKIPLINRISLSSILLTAMKLSKIS